MYKIKLKSDGIMFVDPVTSKSTRTPYHFLVNESNLELYKSYIERNRIEYEIEDFTDNELHEKEKKQTQPLSIYRPKSDVNFDLKINN